MEREGILFGGGCWTVDAWGCVGWMGGVERGGNGWMLGLLNEAGRQAACILPAMPLLVPGSPGLTAQKTPKPKPTGPDPSQQHKICSFPF